MDTETLSKLVELKEKGAISEAEFQQEKAKLLNADSQPNAKDTKSLFQYFKECVMTQKYFSCNGRARRREYWGFVLFNILFSILFSFFGETIGNIYTVAILLPSITVLIRRMHDVNFSGWWASPTYIAGILIVLFFAILPSFVDSPEMLQTIVAPYIIVIYIALILAFFSAIFTFILTLIGSNRQPNKYGPVPEGIQKA